MKLNKRKFDAAKNYMQLSNWVTHSPLFQDEISQDLATIRARSREASINDPYGRRYFKLLSINTIGAEGFRLKVLAKDFNEQLDKLGNKRVLESFNKWSKNCTTDELSLRKATKLILETVARDGEVLIHHLYGPRFGEFGYKFRIIDCDLLDENYNKNYKSGITIRSGIEQDEYGTVLAYHLWQSNPNDIYTKRNKRVRIPASEIIHLYDKERGSGNRGIPWTCAALIGLTHLKEYSRSEQIAARVASAKMGFFTKQASATEFAGESDGDDNNDYFINEASAGEFELLPEGWDVKSFDPQNPNGNFQMFNAEILKGIAASLNIQYYSLTGDLSSTSYSSLRSGAIQEQEYFKILQEFLISQFMEPIFAKFLEMALLTKKIPYGIDKFEKFNKPEFLGKAWPSVDPSKRMLAEKIALDYKLKSKQQVISEMGRDPENVFNEIAEDNELMELLNISMVDEQSTDSTQAEILGKKEVKTNKSKRNDVNNEEIELLIKDLTDSDEEMQ